MATREAPMRYLNLRAEQTMIRDLQKLADAERRSLSNYIRFVLAEHIEAKKGSKP